MKKLPPFTPQPLNARTDTQQQYLDYLQRHPMVFATGPAGCGKTYLATAYAIDQLAADRTHKLILTRATVPVSGENLGFLPGGVRDKMDPWVAEFFAVIEERIGTQRFRQLLGDQRIEVIPFAFLRGRTLKNAIVLVDEAQNTTPAQAKMLVTRIGKNAQMLINGDLEQSDLPGRNGLQELLEMVEEQDLLLPVVRFTTRDVRRSRLCQLWVEAYARRQAA